jgi:hypothetical protein
MKDNNSSILTLLVRSFLPAIRVFGQLMLTDVGNFRAFGLKQVDRLSEGFGPQKLSIGASCDVLMPNCSLPRVMVGAI